MLHKRFIITLFASICLGVLSQADAQLTAPRTLQGTPQNVSKLEEQLVNGLRATRVEQQQFLRNIVLLVNQNRLDRRLVNAIYKWARLRQPLYPFPYFERGLRVESKKRGLVLAPVATVIRSGTVTAPQPLR